MRLDRKVRAQPPFDGLRSTRRRTRMRIVAGEGGSWSRAQPEGVRRIRVLVDRRRHRRGRYVEHGLEYVFKRLAPNALEIIVQMVVVEERGVELGRKLRRRRILGETNRIRLRSEWLL